MAKLSFVFGCMNSGKSARLAMTYHAYTENGLHPRILKPTTDIRDGIFHHEDIGVFTSRALKEDIPCLYLDTGSFSDFDRDYEPRDYQVILVDEAQFLSEKDVEFLSDIVDQYNIPVVCYGLKTDCKGRLFTGSKRLIELADEMEECRGVCACGKRSIMHVRISGDADLEGAAGVESEKVRYVSVCRRCFKKYQSLQSLVHCGDAGSVVALAKPA